MLTVEELGRRAKIKYPKKFGHMTDADAGREIKSLSPGKYDEFEDTNLTTFVPQQLAPISQQPISDKQINQLVDYYHPSRGVFTSWWQRRKSEGRSKLLAHLNDEQLLVVEQGAILERAIREKKKEEIEFKLFVAHKALELLEIQNIAKRLETATNENISLTLFDKKQDIKITDDLYLKRYQKETKINIKKERKLSKIRVKEYEEIARIDTLNEITKENSSADIRIREAIATAKLDWERYLNEKNLDVQAAILANLAPVAEITALTNNLLHIINTIEDFKQLPPTPAIVESIKVFTKNKKRLEKVIDERFQGLF